MSRFFPKKIDHQFKIIAFLEGMSYLLLLFISMPLKYFFDYPEAVSLVGMFHGVLFVAYVLYLILSWSEYKWTFKKVVIAFVASLLPFGTIWFDRKYGYIN